VGSGIPRAGRPYALELARLDAALRSTRHQIGLAEALELSGGPLESLPATRERERRAREAFWAHARSHPLCERDPAVRRSVEALRSSGTLARIGSERLLLEALDLGLRLPARPPVERSRVAAEALGDPHALDDGRPLARLVLRQLAARAGEEPPDSALGRRRLLARFGVVSDALSCDVLVLGLRPTSKGPLARALGMLDGRHMRITLAHLESEELAFAPGVRVFTCENPVVVAAAEERLWPLVPPLVCTGGWPNSAVAALLGALRRGGAAIAHHGDLDWEGLRIFAWLRERFDVAPWRLDASSYRDGLLGAKGGTETLKGSPPGDGVMDELVAAMRSGGRVLSEELVLHTLLDDLARAAAS
jgi:uncharacterized protein (TIGR02679 family)